MHFRVDFGGLLGGPANYFFMGLWGGFCHACGVQEFQLPA